MLLHGAWHRRGRAATGIVLLHCLLLWVLSAAADEAASPGLDNACGLLQDGISPADVCPWPPGKDLIQQQHPSSLEHHRLPLVQPRLLRLKQQPQEQQQQQQQQQQQHFAMAQPPAEAHLLGQPGDPCMQYIVRFTEYAAAQDHKAALEAVLGPPASTDGLCSMAPATHNGGNSNSRHWAWVQRHNKAAGLPTDFALVSIPTSHLQQVEVQLPAVAHFRDIHPDRRVRASLKWQHEGPLASILPDLSSNGSPPAAPRMDLSSGASTRHLHTEAEDASVQHGQAAGSAADHSSSGSSRPEPGSSSSTSPSLSQPGTGADLGLDPSSIFYTTKKPGRLTTPPSIGLDLEPKTELRRRGTRKLAAATPADAVTNLLKAKYLWDLGYSGKGIKVGVFDTGIIPAHPHIRNIKERTNWTHQDSLSDGLGHGSFVAGVIGSQDSVCPGFAPDVDLYTFKVFTDDQVSYTSWFLDAFNYAIACNLDVVNLSIGGPDFLDQPFVDKVLEVTSNGVIMVSAIGNDGPLYGTLNNPADMLDVIGVGGIDNDGNLAAFSSRGMTTWELPTGTGRMKPDVMAYGREVFGSKINSGCRSLSGTSVASPVVAGAVCLLASTLPEDKRWMLNPASMKQALVEGAARLGPLNQLEQGSGKVDLAASYKVMANYTPRASLHPGTLDFTDCPYMWPHCRQPLYAFAQPLVYNATILNGMGVTGKVVGNPTFEASDEGGKLLHVTFAASEVLWPWTGALAVYVEVSPEGATFNGTAHGTITFTVESPPRPGDPAPLRSTVKVPLVAAIIPTPPRARRLLWDQFRSIKYPPGYVPRDNLDVKSDILDWHGDHLATNYHDLYNALRDRGYYVETLSGPATCFDAANYGALLVVDSEEEFYPAEVEKLARDVKELGMGLVVFAEWYHADSLSQMRFFDDNTRSWWTPITGGSNVPALNDLLAPHGIALGDTILTGTVKVAQHSVQVTYGTNIAKFPPGATLVKSRLSQVTASGQGSPGEHAALGWARSGKGAVMVLGDSNCLDSSHAVSFCFDFLSTMLDHLLGPTPHKDLGATQLPPLEQVFAAPGSDKPPLRRPDVNFTRYSWVLSHPLECYQSAPCQFRSSRSPACPPGAAWKRTSKDSTAAAGPAPAAPGAEVVASSSPAFAEPAAPVVEQKRRETAAAAAASTPAPSIVKGAADNTTDNSTRADRKDTAGVDEPAGGAPAGVASPSEPSGNADGGSKGRSKIISEPLQQGEVRGPAGVWGSIWPLTLLICVVGVVAVGLVFRSRASLGVRFKPLPTSPARAEV